MDISGLTNTSSASAFPGYGGTASLPAGTQAMLLAQSQSLSLLPAAPASNFGNLADIYTAVGKQALGALSGLSAFEITQLSMGIGDGQTTAAPQASAGTSSPSASQSLSSLQASGYPSYFYPTDGPNPADTSSNDPGSTAPSADPAASDAASPSAPAAQPDPAASSSSFKDPAIGATLDQLLKEAGYVAPEANPYVVNQDFFADQGSLGSLLDSTI